MLEAPKEAHKEDIPNSKSHTKMTEVKLRIYEFQITRGITEYHAEINAFDKSLSYSEDGLEISMIQNKDGWDGYKLVGTFDLGFADIYEFEFDEYYAPELDDDFTSEKYHLFFHNCRHNALKLLRILKPSQALIGIKVLENLNSMSESLMSILPAGFVFALSLINGLIMCTENTKDNLLILILFLLMAVLRL